MRADVLNAMVVVLHVQKHMNYLQELHEEKSSPFTKESLVKKSSTSVACMHCTDAPCQQVCPVDCFYIRADGVVLHDKEKCIGCGYCLYACPFGAPQFPRDGAFGTKGAMDKCTMCAGGPFATNSHHEFELYGQNRIAEGKVPVCAAMCSTKALLVGDAESVSNVIRARVMARGGKEMNSSYGWNIAYKNK